MVTVTDYRIVTTEEGDSYVRLVLSGDLSLVRSQDTGRHYATIRKCSIGSTFDEQTAEKQEKTLKKLAQFFLKKY